MEKFNSHKWIKDFKTESILNEAGFVPGDVFGGGGEGDAETETTVNVVSKKFDLLLKDKQQFQKVAKIYGKVSIVKQVDFLMYLLDALGTPGDTKKKLKMRL